MTGTIHSGDMCAVMGPSGAGKTTMLDIISKRKTEGKILGKAVNSPHDSAASTPHLFFLISHRLNS